MSELKAHDLVDIQDYRGEVYLKSEADKVISDLESRNAQLRKDKANLLRDNENLKLEIKSQKLGRLNDKLQYDITERHHKYKRCLDKANLCFMWFLRYEQYLNNCVRTPEMMSMWMLRKNHCDRWRKRWLELAEKFKEVK